MSLTAKGLSPQPYGEEDATNPLSQYGLSKLAGEQLCRRACRRLCHPQDGLAVLGLWQELPEDHAAPVTRQPEAGVESGRRPVRLPDLVLHPGPADPETPPLRDDRNRACDQRRLLHLVSRPPAIFSRRCGCRIPWSLHHGGIPDPGPPTGQFHTGEQGAWTRRGSPPLSAGRKMSTPLSLCTGRACWPRQ